MEKKNFEEIIVVKNEIGDQDLDNDSKTSNQNNSELIVPKKRGRKKKKDHGESPQKQPAENEIEIEIVSRSGRKRKSVNYFALANPDIVAHISDNEDLTSSKKIKSDPAKKESRNVSKNIKLLEKMVSNEGVVKSEFGSQKNEGEDNDHNEVVNTQDNSLGAYSNDTEESEIHVRKEKIYKKTGNTTQMLNTLFSQVDFKKDVTDENDDKTQIKGNFKRGRPSKKVKIRENVDQNTETVELDHPEDHKPVICAVCNVEVGRTDWVYHKQRKHNNLAWRIGEPPLDLTDMEFVKQILNALYVARKPFYCDQCDKSMKSVNGYLSHKSVCGKIIDDVKVPCQYCHKKMMPVSIPSHIRNYHEEAERETKIAKNPKKSSTVIHPTRQSATKASQIIKHCNLESSGLKPTFTKYFDDLSFMSSNVVSVILHKQINASKRVACKYPDCSFECLSAEDIRQHLKFCVNKPEDGYVCKHCLKVQLTISDIIEHIGTDHGVIIKELYEPESDSVVKKRRSTKKTTENERSMKRTPYFLPSHKVLDNIFEKSHEWTLEFCRNYLSTEIPKEHFPCLKENWALLPADEVENYLPRMGYSCDVGFATVVDFQDVLHKDHTFRKFHLFEPYLENNGNSTIFCGGPINAISWLPTPYTDSDNHQIIAVATRNHPDDKFTIESNYAEKCLVQFWDVGPLKNLETSMYRPRLRFCLSYNHGPIWDMQWCPSNCFDSSEPPEESERFRRMGVLAVAGSNSAVHIYSVPYLKSSGQFYNSTPVLILLPTTKQDEYLGNRKFYASRMSWSKAAGHKYLAVGYTNGMVAMYNLWSDSQLLCKKEGNITVLFPYQTFQAHSHYISAIALYHLDEGKRWLLTGSYDRAVSLWDLNDPTSPIQTTKRNIVNDAIWMNNWLAHVVAYDEASTIGPAVTVVQQARDFLSDPLYLFHCSAAITCLSGSEWLNGIFQANAVGEIFATFPKQLLMNLSWKYMKNKKLLFGYTTLVEKDKTIEERLKENAEKEKALRNQLLVKTVIKTEDIPLNKEVTHLDYNPHYYQYEPLMYHEVNAKYGLVFCDHKMNSMSDFPPKLQEHMAVSSKTYGSSKPNIYPLQAINRIQLNVNRQSSTYYATGYQAGFVRLTCMRFLSKDPQIVADSNALNKL